MLKALVLGICAQAVWCDIPPKSTAPPAAACERVPAYAPAADKHYQLGVAGEPDVFLPGELYTVSLQGVDSGEGPTPFVGFKIWAELDNETVRVEDSAGPIHKLLGAFQAYDAQTKVDEHCQPAVTNATEHPKIEVQVLWSAPLSSANTCIRLNGRAEMVPGAAEAKGGEPGVSRLSRKLCGAPPSPAAVAPQPPLVEPCCACDEAKYEVTFEGLWSRNTHPRQFPSQEGRAHFSDLIGASHTARHRVWQAGRVASAGLKRLANDGVTTALEKELKAESDHIRTIIKARGISWQQIGGAGIPSTFAVFRVDAKHHLVSLASKLAPSPDWIVGVSALELCNPNCTWSNSIVLPLFPYDVGSDSGITYMYMVYGVSTFFMDKLPFRVERISICTGAAPCMSIAAREPTVPAVAVRPLRPDWPNDTRSPFYNAKGEMRPFARLRLNRLRLYEKNCDGSGISEGISETVERGACALREWGPWSPCSVSCGPGRASRQRHYVQPARAKVHGCREPLTQHQNCYGPRRHCRAPSEYEPDPAESSGRCAVSPWSEWSACEGCGVRARTRHYVVRGAAKRCHVGRRADTVMHQALPCPAGPCYRPPGILENSTNYDWFFVDKGVAGECKTSPWGTWSPCSASCGRGRRLRTRLLLMKNSDQQTLLNRRLLLAWNRLFAAMQGLEVPKENVTSEDPALDKAVREHQERCQFTLTQQEALCDGEEHTCEHNVTKEICKLPVAVGPCRLYEERWFYDGTRNLCEPFGYTGCGGNGNNFRTREQCRRICVVANTTLPAVDASSIVNLKSSKQLLIDNEVMINDSPQLTQAISVNCETTQWLGWSKCFGDCTSAIKLNYRLVTTKPSGSGKVCPNLVKHRTCRPLECKKHEHLDRDLINNNGAEDE